MNKQHSHRIRNLAIYILVLVVGFVVRQLPRKISLKLGAAIGDLAYRIVKHRRQIALKNLKMALGNEKDNVELWKSSIKVGQAFPKLEELKWIARCSFQNMGKTLVEFLRTPAYNAERLQSLVKIEGVEHLQRAMDAGKGVIAVSAHFGNWELIFQVMSALGYKPAVIVQPFKHQRLDVLVNSYRTKYNGQVIKKETSVKEVLKHLRKGLPIAFMGDQNAGNAGVFVDFFGTPASAHRGPMMFALRTGAPVINIFNIRQADDSHLITISKPVELEISGDMERDIEVNTARLAKILEELIRRYPCQWLWMHNRWKARPSGCRMQDTGYSVPVSRKSVLILSDGKPGHYNQSLGIMDRIRDVSVKIVEVRFKRKWRDDLLRVSTRLLAGVKIPRGMIKAMLEWAMEFSSSSMLLSLEHFDVILSTGSSVAAPNILLGKLMGAKTAVCNKPSPVGIKHFNLVILPEHSRPRHNARNVVMTLGVPNRITPEYVTTVGMQLEKELIIVDQRVIGILLGGDDPYYSIPPGMASQLCDVLLNICSENSILLALTTSRRTHPKSEDVIKSKMLGSPLCCLLVLASEPQELWKSSIPAYAGISKLEQTKPVPGILGISDLTIVTEDSFSMICEAASSGRKIVILQTERRKQGHPKRERVYQMLTELGYARRANMSNLKNVVLDLLGDSTAPKVLDDAKVAADALRGLIDL